jgi:hypothetical protein
LLTNSIQQLWNFSDLVIILSINTPDIAGFTKKGNKNRKELLPCQVSIVLNGKWRAENLDKRATIKIIGNRTVITGKFVHGIPIQLKLVQI